MLAMGCRALAGPTLALRFQDDAVLVQLEVHQIAHTLTHLGPNLSLHKSMALIPAITDVTYVPVKRDKLKKNCEQYIVYNKYTLC